MHKQKIKTVAIGLAKIMECKPHRYNDVLVALFHDIQSDYGVYNSRYTVSLEIFREQIEFLIQNKANWLLASELLTIFKDEQCLKSAVCITFDDGKLSSFEPILEVVEKGGKVTQFIIPEKVGEGNNMSWSQIRELSSQGVEIGSHTLSHPDLTKLSEKKVKKELRDSKTILEDKVGTNILSFAYPYGAWNRAVANFVEEAGYQIAFTTQHVYATVKDMPVATPRFEPSTKRNMQDLFCGHSHLFYKYLKRILAVQSSYQ